MVKMNRATFTSLYSLLLVLLGSQLSVSAQSPWAKGKGNGYGQVVFNTIPTYSSLFDGGHIGLGDTKELERKISEAVVSTYWEVGVSERLTFGGTVPFVMVSSGDAVSADVTPTYEADNLAALGNIAVFGKYTFIDRKLKMAFISQVNVPTSQRNNQSGLSTGINAFSIIPKISAGGSKNKWYYYSTLGYDLRTNDFHDFLTFEVEAGRRMTKRLSLILNIHRQHSLRNGDGAVDSPANIQTGLYTSFQEFSGYLMKVFAQDLYKGFGGFASVGGAFPLGDKVSVPLSPAFSAGVFYEW